MKRGIVIFAKAPVPGRVKTRLAASIGDVAAADLHTAFIADLVELVAAHPAQAFLALAGDEDHPAFDVARQKGLDFIEQGEGDLGARLAHVTRMLFETYQLDQLVILGSDSPTLCDKHLDEAFERLALCDVVFGPSFDGGYYLVALNEAHAAVFRQIPWSTNRTLEYSWRQAKAASLLPELLPYWYDVDDFDDLLNLRFHLTQVLCHNGATRSPHTKKALDEIEFSRFISTP